MVKVVLKGLIEAIRETTLSTEGYQQIQVDTQLLRQLLPYFLPDSSIADTMLDEVMVSAADRCVEPKPLEQGVTWAIVSEATQRLKLSTNDPRSSNR